MIQEVKENIVSKKGRKTTILGIALIIASIIYFLAPVFGIQFEQNSTAMLIVLVFGGLLLIAPDDFVKVALAYFKK